jgi:hypothetical protein
MEINVPNEILNSFKLPMLHNLKTNSKLQFQIMLSDKRGRKIIDTTLNAITKMPAYREISLLNNMIAPVSFDSLDFHNKLVTSYLQSISDTTTNINELTYLFLFVNQNSLGYFIPESVQNVPIYRMSDTINISVEINKPYTYNYIFGTSRSDSIPEKLQSIRESKNNNCLITKVEGKTILSSYLVAESNRNPEPYLDRGLKSRIAYYGYNDDGSSYFQIIGMAVFDTEFPSLKYKNAYEPSIFSPPNYGMNDRYVKKVEEDKLNRIRINHEGEVRLQLKEFGGYSVPFIGTVIGDVEEFFINGKKIDFEVGIEFFFRQIIFLNTGYNRVPVKIIDKRGNTNNTYFEINME